MRKFPPGTCAYPPLCAHPRSKPPLVLLMLQATLDEILIMPIKISRTPHLRPRKLDVIVCERRPETLNKVQLVSFALLGGRKLLDPPAELVVLTPK